MPEVTQLSRLKIRLKISSGDNSQDDLLADLLLTAKDAILSARFPYGDWPDELEPRYAERQIMIAVDLYNKMGAEGETSHTENGISRTYESSWISAELLADIVPYCGVVL